MSSFNNRAAWLRTPKEGQMQEGEAAYTKPGQGEITVRAHAVALNAIDFLKPQYSDLIMTYVKYPFIFGMDIAGEVVEVGEGVTQCKVGDRVIGYGQCLEEERCRPAYGGFQLYPVLLARMTAIIPDSLSYEQAAVIPLGFSTAASALFTKDQLALELPSLEKASTRAEERKKTVIVWGGSSAVGTNAVQLAHAAGYDVISTASPKNFQTVQSLGARQVFDYRSTSVVKDIVAAIPPGNALVGSVCIGDGGAEKSLEILCTYKQGTVSKRLALVSFPVPQKPPKPFSTLRIVSGLLLWNVLHSISKMRTGAYSRSVVPSDILKGGECDQLFGDFLPKALEDGKHFRPAPSPQVIGSGLGSIQAGITQLSQGVSATKLVVTL